LDFSFAAAILLTEKADGGKPTSEFHPQQLTPIVTPKFCRDPRQKVLTPTLRSNRVRANSQAVLART
jgi:hypothetical protein